MSSSKLRRRGQGEGEGLAQDHTRAAGELCVGETTIKTHQNTRCSGPGVRSGAVRMRREKPPGAARTGGSPAPHDSLPDGIGGDGCSRAPPSHPPRRCQSRSPYLMQDMTAPLTTGAGFLVHPAGREGCRC